MPNWTAGTTRKAGAPASATISINGVDYAAIEARTAVALVAESLVGKAYEEWILPRMYCVFARARARHRRERAEARTLKRCERYNRGVGPKRLPDRDHRILIAITQRATAEKPGVYIGVDMAARYSPTGRWLGP